MKAITIKQPWASLIVEGIKDIENRTWPTKFRGRVLVHAALKGINVEFTSINKNPEQREKYDELFKSKSFLPQGAIIGSVEIVDCVVNHPSIWAEKTGTPECKYGACKYNQREGIVECKSCKHLTKPIYNWVLANPIKFPEPIPAKGKLSFWEYPDLT